MIVNQIPFIRVLGTKIHMVELSEVVQLMDYWIRCEPNKCHHIVNSGMHGVIEAYKDAELGKVFDAVDLFAPDGILMVMLSRIKGFKIRKKHTGPDILWRFAELANELGYRNYFYGDEECVLQSMEAKLISRLPGLKIVGHRSPPFRPLTVDEISNDIDSINKAKPDVLWVSLGMPRQEIWISENQADLNVPVVVGAGAAFKFVSEDIKRSPSWMSNSGFEWLWRLSHEPARIWRRVFLDAPLFIVLVILEMLRHIISNILKGK